MLQIKWKCNLLLPSFWHFDIIETNQNVWAWETVPLHHSYFCVSSAYKQKRPKIFCVRSKQQNECTLNRCEVIYGTEGINDIKRPLCVALLADDVNNKTATCFFSCRSSLFDAGRPLSLSFCHCVSLRIHTGLSPSRPHTHTYYSFLRAVSDSGMKSISEPAPSHPGFGAHSLSPWSETVAVPAWE